MIEDVLPHPTPEISNRHPARVVRFIESPIGISSETEVSLNPRYVISEEELRQKMYLSGEGESSTVEPFPRIPLSRGRESGSSLEPILVPKKLSDGSTYQVVGVIGLKALGLRELGSTTSQDYRSSSLGVVGVTEAMIDVNVGDFLSEDGASVGDYLAVVSTPKEVFLSHFEDPKIGGEGGALYAKHLRDAWSADDEYKDRKYIDGIARITDPERLDYRTFTNPYLLLSSALWLQKELQANGEEKFVEYYNLPVGYADHLKGVIEFDKDKLEDLDNNQDLGKTIQSHARLLTYIITRNYAIALKSGVNTSFSNKDIGNLGKLHDFPLAMNHLVESSEKSGEMVVDPTLPMTRKSFSDLAIDMFLDKKGGSFLEHDDFIKMCDFLSDKYGVAIDGRALVEERETKDKQSGGGFAFNL